MSHPSPYFSLILIPCKQNVIFAIPKRNNSVSENFVTTIASAISKVMESIKGFQLSQLVLYDRLPSHHQHGFWLSTGHLLILFSYLFKAAPDNYGKVCFVLLDIS